MEVTPEERTVGRVRALATVLANRALQARTTDALVSRVVRSLAITVVVALACTPLAVAWGIAHAQTDDYLGPHQAHFATNFSGDLEMDLGPLGNAYLPSPVAPIGVEVIVGGVGLNRPGAGPLFSEATLSQYAQLASDTDEVIRGLVDAIVADVIVESVKAEIVLLLLFAAWVLRRQLLAPWLVSHASLRRTVAVFALVTVVLVGSIVAPQPALPPGRVEVGVAHGTRAEGLTVDSVLLAELFDRGVTGVRLLTERQQRAVADYEDKASTSLAAQLSGLPAPVPGETMLFGYSDLHCNQAMTTLIERLIGWTQPRLVFSSGDDTVHGTAAERGCITREAAMAKDKPVVVASGNHDSEVTETQMRSAGMTVLDGQPVEQAELSILGDDDPEHNIPFSVNRVKERPESEEELGVRMVETARSRPVDVMLVHQPAASGPIMTSPNPPARLVQWGHFHSETGPVTIMHDDGSWTVGMQAGTAGGVKQPTITSFSTPFSPPLVTADTYFYFRDEATGLITGVQSVRFTTDGAVVIEKRITTGNLAALPSETRERLTDEEGALEPAGDPQPTSGASTPG